MTQRAPTTTAGTPGRIRTITLGLSAAITLAAAGAMAGKATISSGDGQPIEFEYAGDSLRMNTGEAGSYMLVLDGTMYVVSNEGGQPMVFNASSMMRGMMSSAAQFAPEQFNSEFVSLEDTGRDETVAGIKGDVYTLTYRENDETLSEEVVLTKDPRAREFRDAMFAMASMAEDIAGEEAAERGRDLQKEMARLNAGILRFGREMKVTAISDEKIAAARFELPAEPMDMQGLGSMLGGAMSQQPAEAGEGAEQDQGGLFSSMMGAFGQKAERQKDRAGETVDNAVDEETDKAVDNAVSKALGKLFGD